MLLMLALLSHFIGQSAGQCPPQLPSCSCLQGNMRIICTGAPYTEFPDFPTSIKESARVVALGNDITAIMSDDLEGFVHLRELDLSGNRISYIEPGSFSSSTLTDLNLSDNLLTEIEDYLFINSSIVTLNLGRNAITGLSPFSLSAIESGAFIDLEGNEIETLNEDHFANYATFHQVSLSGNPLRCDCDLRWTQSPRSSSAFRVLTGTCSTPAHFTGIPLQTLEENQLLCNCTSCENGACNMTAGVCECDDGFVGDYCNTSCPLGSFGSECAQNCTCLSEYESFPCDNVDGTCNCLPGYTGLQCEQICLDGTFGVECEDDCECNGTTFATPSCDHMSGRCNCLPGYTGSACEEECSNGLYGSNCSEMCQCMNGGICHPATGACNCAAEWTGQFCQTGVETAPSTDGSATADRQTTSTGELTLPTNTSSTGELTLPTNTSSTGAMSAASALPEYAIAVLILGLSFVLLVGAALLSAVICAWVSGKKKREKIAPQELMLTEIADPLLEKNN